jgi:hyperosmotically inducible protein
MPGLDRSNRGGPRRALVLLVAALVGVVAVASLPAQAQKSAGESLDDSTINATVKAELIANASTKARQINVETYKSVVQLSGFVESETEKADAERVASAVAGVREVRNSIVVAVRPPVSQRIADGVTTGRVKAALIDDKDVSSNQINVETRAGVVQLSGFVLNEKRRERAAFVASRVEGVQRVENALVIKPEERPSTP